MKPRLPRERAARLIRDFRPDQPPADGPQLVVIHPGAVPAADYQLLADHLPAEVGLIVVDLEQIPAYFEAALHGEWPATSIDELADQAAAALRAHRWPDRGWLLAGWSFGGVVGYAMSSRLAEADLPERLLVMDSIAPIPSYTAAEDELNAELVMPWFVTYLTARRGIRALLAADAFAGLDIEPALKVVLDAGQRQGFLRPETELPGLRKLFTAYRSGLVRNNRLVAGYTPARARLPITLLRPERGLLSTPQPLGWEVLADSLTLRRCPGDHYSMLRDPVALTEITDVVARTRLIPSRATP